MILESVEHGPLIWPTGEENGVIRTKKYAKLSGVEKIQGDCDMKATNIILQGISVDIYSLMNHHRVVKDLWERVQLLMQGTSLTKQERECKLNGQGLGAYGNVEGVNGNVEGVNGGVGGEPDFSTIIARQLQNLLPAILAQVGNQRNVGNQNGNAVNKNVQENVRNVLVNGNREGYFWVSMACLVEGIQGLFSGRYRGLVRVTCGYPWPELEGNHMDFGMIRERLRRQCVVMISFLIAPRVSALAGCDRLVSELSYREFDMPSHSHKKYRWGNVFATRHRIFIEPGTGLRMKRTNHRTRVPIGLYPCHIEEKMTIKEVRGESVMEWKTKVTTKKGIVIKFPGYKLATKEKVEEKEGLMEV
nr:hypothetical protein [Tanacetum cinerariifolium]